MKRIINYGLKFIMIFAIVFASAFGAKTFSKNSNILAVQATAQEEQVDKMSIFIRKPTYSCYVGGMIYFIDDYDKILKVYNTVNNYFENQYLDVSNYDIKDAEVLNDSLYLIVSSSETKNKIIQIKLPELEIVNYGYEFDSAYTTIYVQNLTFGESDYLLVSLTPNTNETSPLMVLFNEQKEATAIPISFGTESEATLIKENLIKMFTYQEENETLHILFAYSFDSGAKISHVSVDDYDALISYQTGKVSTGITILTSDLLKNLNGRRVVDVNFMLFDEESHIVVTYEENDSFWLGFTPNILLESGDFNIVGTHTCYDAKYMLIYNDVVTDCNGQSLHYSTISHKADNQDGSLIQSVLIIINNPDCEITYFEEDNFVFKTTTSSTKLLEHPWDFEEIVEIDANQDVINLGTIQVKSLARTRNAVQIEDYDYCMYTHGGKNYLGYIKNTDLKTKEELSVDSVYKTIEDQNGNKRAVVTVWPNTTLYSLPTNIVGSLITNDLTSQKIGEIVQNSKVEILDVLDGYSSNGVKFVKVLVNGETTGYIDASRIYSPKDKVNFVVTNASIDHDGTKVYLSASESSVVTHILSKGKQVRIDGKRDTKSGFTKITFNDEYGNEFTGYISSDFVKSDSWSTLQIIGSILIAVNIGLLILILVYKNKHVLKNNVKIDVEKEENSL